MTDNNAEKQAMGYKLYGILIVLGGIYCVWCAYKNYDWFMGHSKAWLPVKLFGRNGARIFYMIVGTVITLAGVGIIIVG